MRLWRPFEAFSRPDRYLAVGRIEITHIIDAHPNERNKLAPVRIDRDSRRGAQKGGACLGELRGIPNIELLFIGRSEAIRGVGRREKENFIFRPAARQAPLLDSTFRARRSHRNS